MEPKDFEIYQTSSHCSLYEVGGENDYFTFISSTPETRKIMNDPTVVGVEYTSLLQQACVATLKAFSKHSGFKLHEDETLVLNILRGGLNFELRDALCEAYSWNTHGSWFVSSQRVCDDEGKWSISEDSYKKVYFTPKSTIILGDVAATGTTLKAILPSLIEEALEEDCQIRHLVLFTIGGSNAASVIEKIDKELSETFPKYEGSAVIYFEGIFNLAGSENELSIKENGTDLLRTKSVLSPEFLSSQYDEPSYPIERCVIYDAGARAFHVPEYVADVIDYWEQVLELAKNGIDFDEYLEERFPELDQDKFKYHSLKSIAKEQLKKLEGIV